MNTLRGIFPEPKTIPKRNFILENKRNLRQDRTNSAHLSKSTNEYKKTPSQIDKLKVCSNKSAPFRSSTSSVASKSKPSSAQPQTKRKPQSHAKSTTKPDNNNIINSNNDMEKTSSTESNMTEQDPIRAQSPDYSKYAGMTQGKSYTSKAMQTVDINDSEALLKNSVIRYASAGSTKSSTNSLMLHKNEFFNTGVLNKMKNDALLCKSIDGSKESSLTDLDDTSVDGKSTKTKMSQRPGKANDKKHERSAEKFEKDFKAIKVLKSPKLLKNGLDMDPMKAPPNYQRGVLPRYLRNRKNVNQDLLDDSDENCPEGHVTLPDAERKETLGVLRSRFAELVAELNRMPVRTDTLRQKKRKIELEEELVKLEEGIKVFSRPKVYVKIGL